MTWHAKNIDLRKVVGELHEFYKIFIKFLIKIKWHFKTRTSLKTVSKRLFSVFNLFFCVFGLRLASSSVLILNLIIRA